MQAQSCFAGPRADAAVPLARQNGSRGNKAPIHRQLTGLSGLGLKVLKKSELRLCSRTIFSGMISGGVSGT